MKKNRKKIIAWILAIVIALIAAVCITGYYAINKVFSLLMESQEFTDVFSSPEQSVSNNTSEENTNNNEDNISPTPEPPSENDSDNNPDNNVNNKSEDDEPTSNIVATPQPSVEPNTDEKPVATPTKPPKKTGNNSYDKETLGYIGDQLTFADKMNILAICIKGLPKSEIDNFMKMASDGITSKEFSSMYKIYKDSFKEEDRAKLRKYYHKYKNMID